MRDLANTLHFKRAISPAAAVADNTPIVSQIIDRLGYEQLVFGIAIGAIADADATFAVLLEHGDQANLSDAAAVPDSQLTGSEALAGFKFDDDDKVRKLGYVGPKRYARLTITPANNAGNAFVAAVAILASARYAPTPNPPV
ncbi:hypothetical protein IED13_15435 [Bosea sp. SSUT16]|uniref:Uncharacterized protein n=1 Tax=Bosea spartocytisi TaxID=2773451 RepID=A0A927E9A9_9HYPH|nr:hypothetical protein [Bosea spartocytisi]MBD3847101.1 hypothetical protein [Bosea spartocytisi]MCT4474203.1 hypothetical protein [Bosea spartocytisi]